MRRLGGGTLATLAALACLTVPARAEVASAPVTTAPPARQAMFAGGSAYPRLIRLADSGSANGTILASVNAVRNNSGVGIIEASTDGGRSFHQIATIADPTAANGAVSAGGSLYELPSPVGTMPAGTLLWVVGTGYGLRTGARHVAIRLWDSRDHGRTWRYVTDIARSGTPFPYWEPSLSVAADGQLVAFYSDETDKTYHDQKLVQARSADGVRWTDTRETVVSDDWYVRPGMATVIRLPDGGYFMTYEVCNNDLVHTCASYFRTSTDGWNYGDPTDLGTVIRTVDGQYARGTPDVAWSPGPGRDGRILAITEMMADSDGSLAADDGTVLMANDNEGSGAWYQIPAPIPLGNADAGMCRNFAPAILPSVDGKSMLEAADDFAADGVCTTYFASGPLAPPASGAPAGGAVPAVSSGR
ncbi:MAG TPA: sialidase family protein [Pseudonocardiaceae bacterium]|jgi:hypothetical protein|nr:sialidase family protein [Pseudonocardiaceae bacterium]